MQLAPAAMATEPTAPAPTSDNALIAELRSRLKVPRSSELPKHDHVAIAVRLARDPEIDPSKGNFWARSGITSSQTRARIKTLARRMAAEGHLAAAEQAVAVPQPSSALLFAHAGIMESLLVQQDWIAKRTPVLSDLRVEPLVLSADGRHATRVIVVKRDLDLLDELFKAEQWEGGRGLLEELARGEIKYDLPPADGEGKAAKKRRLDRYRQSEKAVLRKLDVVAEGRRAWRRHEQIAERRERTSVQVPAVLEDIIRTVEHEVTCGSGWCRAPHKRMREPKPCPHCGCTYAPSDLGYAMAMFKPLMRECGDEVACEAGEVDPWEYAMSDTSD